MNGTPRVLASRSATILVVVAGLVVGAAAALAVFPQARERLLPAAGVKVIGQALVGGPFTLTDHKGRRVTDQDFRGRHMLVFFGFTLCPDVCPTALQVASEALNKLGPKAERFVPIFISVDPERDTPSQLASYVESFHPQLIGLTGSQPEIDAVVKAYRVYVRRVEDPKSSAGYTFDHTSLIYVMGSDGGYRTHFTHTTNAGAMAERLARLL
jgi:cytochrome oxidase Cu insertion factor (SCO1/SenC/PrrC family)